jgi:hypothetical protein
VGATPWWAGATPTLGEGDGALSFAVPRGDAEDGYQGILLGHWREDGTLVRAGLLVARYPASRSPTAWVGAAPQPDGDVLLLLKGSAPLTLLPEGGTPVPLDPGPGYERLVVVRTRLASARQGPGAAGRP